MAETNRSTALHNEQLAQNIHDFESCSRILDSIQEIAAAIQNGGDHIALARAIDYIASNYQAHLETVVDQLAHANE